MNKVEGAAQGANVFSVLVTKIMSILKLDDAGKLSKFFKNEIKTLNNAIETLDMNNQTEALEHKMNLSKIDNDIEDAEAAVEDAYTEVKVENITSNEAMQNFSKFYWKNIDDKEANLVRLVEKREDLVKQYDENVKARNEKIAKRKARIAKIS